MVSRSFPAEFGSSEQYYNSQTTLPLPSPRDVPRPIWTTDKIGLTWRRVGIPADAEPPDVPGVTYQYSWFTPSFDLRPDLRSAFGAPKDGVPIWSSAARVYIQLAGNPSVGIAGTAPVLDTSGLTALATDWVNATTNYASANRPADINPETGLTYEGGWGLYPTSERNVSAQFVASGPNAYSILVGFTPPGTGLGGGDGYPVRYWRLQLKFRVFIPTLLPPPPILPVPGPAIPSTLWATVY
jgi:hypothetical protein